MKEEIKNDTQFDWAGILLGVTIGVLTLGLIAMYLEIISIGVKLLAVSRLMFAGYLVLRLESIKQDRYTSVHIDIKATESEVKHTEETKKQ